MDIQLTVSVNGQYQNFVAGMKVPDLLIKAFKPLRTTDVPEMTLVAGETMATSEAETTAIKLREDAAEILAKEITAMLISAMKKHDTFNGYPAGKE